VGKRILIVEDDPDIREVLNAVLAFEGFAPVAAKNAVDALDQLRTFSAEQLPKLVILDVMMPGMDGQTFAKLMRAEPKWSAIPIVIISADGEIADIAQSIGAVASLRKPFELDVFVDVVQNAS
jgi:two-component system, chemotaxis family, chemotaxis protein CheY